MSRCRPHRLASRVCACTALSALTLTQIATADPQPPIHEDFILCNAMDHEIFDQVIAYQEAVDTTEDPMASTGRLKIGRLKASPTGMLPYDVSEVMWGPWTIDQDGVLPPLGETKNGPEIGFDGSSETGSYEVVWTKKDTDGTWFFASASNNCPNQTPNCWVVKNFLNEDFDTDPIYRNRWSPWVTQNSDLDTPEPAKVTYNAHQAASRLPATGKRKAFRELKDEDLSIETTVAGNSDVAKVGHWARIDDKDYIISTLAAGGSGDVDVVLYDPEDPTLTPINITGFRPGLYSLGWIGFDPAADDGNGEYTLVTVETDDFERTFLAVFQKDGPAIDDWVFRYEFAAEVADPALTGLGFHVTSPEPFKYGDFLYIAFVVADEPDFGSSTVGNIMYTRVEWDDPTPQDHHFRILSKCDDANCEQAPTEKRIEPEIHFMPMHYPAVYYTQVAGENDPDNCDEHEHKLMRAFVGQPWTD